LESHFEDFFEGFKSLENSFRRVEVEKLSLESGLVLNSAWDGVRTEGLPRIGARDVRRVRKRESIVVSLRIVVGLARFPKMKMPAYKGS